MFHALAHLTAAMLLAWMSDRLAAHGLYLAPNSFRRWLVATGFMATTGYLVGALIMGWYLLVSLNVWRTHANEAFSALRLASYKSFLRMRFRTDGELKFYAVGLRKPGHAPKLIEEVICAGASAVAPPANAREAQ